jgi:transcription termination factor Rho
MAVLDRPELEASPLADLHAIADQIGLEGFRRLRKAELIDAILGASPPGEAPPAEREQEPAREQEPEREDEPAREEGGGPVARMRRRRSRRSAAAEHGEEAPQEAAPEGAGDEDAVPDESEPQEEDRDAQPEQPASRRGRARGGRERGARAGADGGEDARVAEGAVEVLGNGSAFLRVDPPEASDEDVYISAAQVRRCELVSGDRVSGPVRTPRRSERYPSLVRVDTINGEPADSVSDGSRYEDLPVAWPSERLSFGVKDPTLEAIEWLTPIGLGSRVVVVGPHRAGKSETLRRLLGALRAREDLELSLVLSGVRPEEIAEWGEGPLAPGAALSFAASADAQAQAVERALDAAKRLAARGANAVVLIDGLDGLSANAARRALAAARNLRESGSLTVLAAASEPLGGETTVIALDAALTSSGREPILDLLASGTLRPELLVGEDGAQAIARARAAALDAAH